MIFYECGGGAEEKILSFKLSSANGTQGTFRNGRYYGPIVSKINVMYRFKRMEVP